MTVVVNRALAPLNLTGLLGPFPSRCLLPRRLLIQSQINLPMVAEGLRSLVLLRETCDEQAGD